MLGIEVEEELRSVLRAANEKMDKLAEVLQNIYHGDGHGEPNEFDAVVEELFEELLEASHDQHELAPAAYPALLGRLVCVALVSSLLAAVAQAGGGKDRNVAGMLYDVVIE